MFLVVVGYIFKLLLEPKLFNELKRLLLVEDIVLLIFAEKTLLLLVFWKLETILFGYILFEDI